MTADKPAGPRNGAASEPYIYSDGALGGGFNGTLRLRHMSVFPNTRSSFSRTM